MTDTAEDTKTMQLIIVTGLSGSGKSIAIRVLEDCGYYCVDNLPVDFLKEVALGLKDHGHKKVAMAIDARSRLNLASAEEQVNALKRAGCDVRPLFLTASTPALIARFPKPAGGIRSRFPQKSPARGSRCLKLWKKSASFWRPLPPTPTRSTPQSFCPIP